ncbi:hypothetical protein IJT17_03985 [bacterium]|nr:hypothetical protein [bacterium]
MKPDTIIFVCNSPGEIAGWLQPLVYEARRRWPQCRLVLQLLLCEFASGAEARVSHELLGIEEVLSPYRYADMLFRRMARYRNPLIIHLGGDMFYSALLAKRWKVPLWIYVWGRKWLDRAFCGYFVRNSHDVEVLTKAGISAQKVRLVGDLVADATAAALERQREHRSKAAVSDSPASSSASGPLISFLPGSRERELSGLAPFFMETAQIIKSSIPDCRFQIIVSPFINPQAMHRLLTAPPTEGVNGVRCHCDSRVIFDDLHTQISIVREDHLAHLADSTLAVTIPGTKTSELGCLGVPMLTILPLNRPDLLPIKGLIGLLDFLPWIGLRLKRLLVTRFAKPSRLYALPNILAQRQIVPEMVGVLSAESVAQETLKLLQSPEALQTQTHELLDLYASHKGASQRIFDILGDNSQWPSM